MTLAWLAVMAFALFATIRKRRPLCATANVAESFSDNSGPRAYSVAADEIGASVVVSYGADALHWDTGIPAAYASLAAKPLTGEVVDEALLYEDLPCALLRNDVVVVLSPDDTFSVVNRDLLNEQVEAGRLTFQSITGADVYRPTDETCR